MLGGERCGWTPVRRPGRKRVRQCTEQRERSADLSGSRCRTGFPKLSHVIRSSERNGAGLIGAIRMRHASHVVFGLASGALMLSSLGLVLYGCYRLVAIAV